MDIEEAIEILKQEPDFSLNYYNRENAIDMLLTAYEEKDEKCIFLDKELYNANQEIQDLQFKIKKEKEKNKKAIDFINDKNNYFEDGENWQNILKIKEILEE